MKFIAGPTIMTNEFSDSNRTYTLCLACGQWRDDKHPYSHTQTGECRWFRGGAGERIERELLRVEQNVQSGDWILVNSPTQIAFTITRLF